MTVRFRTPRRRAAGAAFAALLLAASLPAAAGTGTAEAREVYAEVNGRLAGLDREAFTAQRSGVEYTSSVRAWRDAGGVRKVEVTDPDDSGSVVTEYYYRNRALVFAYVAIKGFDGGREVTRVEQRQYFRDARMVRWLGGREKVAIAPADPAFARESKERLDAAAFYRDAAWVAFTSKSGTVRIGGVAKRTTGKVVALANADTACLMELEDERGVRFFESADFAICFQEPPLAGRQVALYYEMASVMAAECQGNPDCGKRTRIPLVVAARPVDAAPDGKPGPREPAPRPASLCTPREEPVFACRTGAKLASVCASRDATRTRGYVEYRYGKPESQEPPEIVLPEGRPLPPRAATADTVAFAGGGGAWMRFRRADHAYVVYTGIGKWGPRGETRERAGLVVERGGRAIAHLECSGPATSLLGPDWFGKAGIEAGGEEFDLPP